MNNTINQQLNEIIDKLDQLAMRYPELLLPSCRAMITEVVYNLYNDTPAILWAVTPIRRIIKDGVSGDDAIRMIDELYNKLGLVSI